MGWNVKLDFIVYNNIFIKKEIKVKQLVILMGTIILGCYIFSLMVGPKEYTLQSTSAKVMEQIIKSY